MVALPANGKCPKCRRPVAVSVIELHPVRSDTAVHYFICETCGHVKIKELALRRERKDRPEQGR